MPISEWYKWRLVPGPGRLIIRVIGAKMYQNSAILTYQSDSQAAIDQLLQRLHQARLQVTRSFDLKVARAAHVGCTCPHHGTDQCDCQMVVLLVYGGGGAPVTLVVHGHDNQTEVALVDTPDQRPSTHLAKAILQAILPPNELGRKMAELRLEGELHAG